MAAPQYQEVALVTPAVEPGSALVDEKGREPGGGTRHQNAECQVQCGQPPDLPLARPEPAALHLMADRVLEIDPLPDRHLGLVLERVPGQPPQDQHGGNRGEGPTTSGRVLSDHQLPPAS